MPYIAFLDMIGTRASALISNDEYTSAINDFSKALTQVGDMCECKIYGYSDNAYVEICDLQNMINFFRYLREILMNQHRYFTAAVDSGTLCAERITLKNNKGFSMKFTAPSTVDIYMKQCHFSGIGISLSSNVINDLTRHQMQTEFCQSIFQKYPVADNEMGAIPVHDLSYNNVILEKLGYIISDYLMTAATNVRAGRYYITPTISMIKCLEKSVLLERLDELITLLSFKSVPSAFKDLRHNDKYSLFYFFALIEYVLSLREQDKSIDANIICERIIKGFSIEHSKLIETLPMISTSVISNINKKNFLNILYNMESIPNENTNQ